MHDARIQGEVVIELDLGIVVAEAVGVVGVIVGIKVGDRQRKRTADQVVHHIVAGVAHLGLDLVARVRRADDAVAVIEDPLASAYVAGSPGVVHRRQVRHGGGVHLEQALSAVAALCVEVPVRAGIVAAEPTVLKGMGEENRNVVDDVAPGLVVVEIDPAVDARAQLDLAHEDRLCLDQKQARAIGRSVCRVLAARVEEQRASGSHVRPGRSPWIDLEQRGSVAWIGQYQPVGGGGVFSAARNGVVGRHFEGDFRIVAARLWPVVPRGADPGIGRAVDAHGGAACRTLHDQGSLAHQPGTFPAYREAGDHVSMGHVDEA